MASRPLKCLVRWAMSVNGAIIFYVIMELRPNQVKPVQIGIDYFTKKNANPAIIVAPTAFGKSIVIAKIAEAVSDNLLILQPSKELLEQNFSKYLSLGGMASIYSASFNSKKIGVVTYATIGSIKAIGKRFKELGFTKMIIDEAHLYPRGVDSMLGQFLTDSGISHVLGLTATPLKLQSNIAIDRTKFSKLVMLTSKSKKGQFYKDILYVSQVEEMVDLGFWAKLEYEQYDIDEGQLIYNSTKADFTEESLDAVYKSNNTDEKILNKIDQIPDRKSIIVFVPSVANAKQLAAITPNSVAIYGDMPTKDRDVAIKGFKAQRIRVIFNVNVLSVGFDHPQLDTIICARPTASLAWFYQALGRGTRIHQSKQNCLIVDFSGNVKRFGRIEKLVFVKDNIWKLYGEGGKLLTGIPLHEIGQDNHVSKIDDKGNVVITMPFGKHKGEEIKDIPKEYRTWMLENIKWNSYNKHIKKEILRLANI